MGINALAHATLLKKLNNGDYDGAANELLKWDHASGQVVPGLTRRRSAERCLFLS
ncbi:lysozyme [Salmonella enterica subsp. enterica serovar Enteritidis]|nr:lysozyme [Salmonella enterica subsp. enterica serovar Enteritidis]